MFDYLAFAFLPPGMKSLQKKLPEYGQNRLSANVKMKIWRQEIQKRKATFGKTSCVREENEKVQIYIPK